MLSQPGAVTTTVRRVLEDIVEELRAVALAADDATGYFPAMNARVTRRVHGRSPRSTSRCGSWPTW